MKIPSALFFAAVVNAAAQSPEVPHKMEVAGITLIIRDDARSEIQKDVDAFTQSPRHFNIKVERAKTYFPIIEKVFQEEGVPADFKYLVLQESALIADAVSSSNAVGFWQFKDFTALEMGLRVDKEIDERLNIVSSTRAAARYLKKNNAMFNNWIYALQAYQMGAGGVMRSVKDSQSGADRMEITGQTYWYVKKFLAHKIAFEPAITGKGQVEVITFENSSGKSLRQLARDVSVDEATLAEYNKWAKNGTVPSDKTYAVIIPLPENNRDVALTAVASASEVSSPRTPVVKAVLVTRKTNGILAVQALPGETPEDLAARAGVDLRKFIKWNDLRSQPSSRELVAGRYYYISRKRLRAEEDFHKVKPGEDLWTISQQYGVKLKTLRKYNRLRSGESVSAGAMLYLASRKPKTVNQPRPIEGAVIVDNDESFNWNASGPQARQDFTTETVLTPPDSLVIASNPSDSTKILQESANDPTPPASSQDGIIQVPLPVDGVHVVEAGQTLYGIARMYNITVMDLVGWNNLSLQDGIKPGQVLQLSSGETASQTKAVVVEEPIVEPIPVGEHVVQPSDTLYSIARQYGVTIKELMDWNNKKDFSLAVGEKLKIRE